MSPRVAALIASLALAACVPAPSTMPSEMALDAHAVGLVGAPGPDLSQDWWTSFRDPALDALVRQALADNPSLHAALARMRSAQAMAAESETQLWPQITFDGQEERTRFSKDYIIPPPFGGRTDWIGTIGANLTWNIDLWGRQADEIDKARATAQAAMLDSRAARLAIAGAVVETYAGLARANAVLEIAQRTAADREATLKLIRAREESGLENRQAEKGSEARLALANENLARAQASRDLLVHALAALVGRGADAYPGLPSPAAQPHAVLALPATLPADLLARRPDILAARARIDAALSGREAAAKAFYPDINLLATAGWAAIGLAPMFSASALQYGAGPALHLPIFDAGKLRAQYAGATAELDEAVADYNTAVLSAVRDTADALTQLRAAEGQQKEDALALAAAEDSYRLAQTRYRTGLENRLVLIEAEDTLLAARQSSAEIAAAMTTSRVALVMALGGGYAPHETLAERTDTSGEQAP